MCVYADTTRLESTSNVETEVTNAASQRGGLSVEGAVSKPFTPYEHVSLAHSTGVPRDHNNTRVSRDYHS